MDIVELKGVNPKMLAGYTSSATNLATDLATRSSSAEGVRKVRQRKNQAYCEFDIMSVYHARKKMQRAAKNKHAKDHPKHQSAERCKDHVKPAKLEKGEKSELSKKIDDLTARNEQIKQLLAVNVKHQHGDDKPDGGSGNVEGRRWQREHKSRRSTRCCPHDDSEITKTSKDTTETTKTPPTTTMTQESETKSKHRSRKERNLAFAENDSKLASGHHGKITVRLKPGTGTSPKKEVNEKVPNSKSQLIRVTNYEKKSKSMDRRPERRHDKNDIITVFENQHILEETDSLMSRETTKRSKTHTRTSSHTREVKSKSPRPDPILERPPIKYEPPKSKEAPKVVTNQEQNQGIKVEELRALHEPTKSTKPRHTSPVKSATPRKELSFSNLNLRPNISHYTSPVRMATTQTSVSRIQTPGYGTLGFGVHSSLLDDIDNAFTKGKLDELKRANKSGKADNLSLLASGSPNVLSQTAIALRDIMKVHELEQKYHQRNLQNNAVKCKFVEKAAFVSDGGQSPKMTIKTPFARNSKFRKTRCDKSDRIVEIASKTCRDQKVNFSVEGVEPPRKLKSGNENYKSLKMENVFNLQVFPGITITQDDLKQSDLNLLCHGGDKRKIHLKQTLNQSLDTFNGSECLYPFRRSLNNTQSEFKRKESCEISYKFKKNYWSNKELPKKKCKDKKKRKPKVVKRDASVQAGPDHLEEDALSERDIGVSTADPSAVQTSKDAQVQFSVPQALSALTRTYPIQSRRSSRSESNLTIYREEYVRKTNYLDCTEVQKIGEQISSQVRNSSPSPSAKPQKVEKPLPKQEIPTNLGEMVQTKSFRESTSPPPRKQRPHYRPRKCANFRSRSKEYLDPRTCQPVRSTGSIRQVPTYTRKTRSRSLTLDRESLAEKININKETIKHHHQEIAALEKCLNEILHRLVQDESVSHGDKNDDSSNSISDDPKNNLVETEETSLESFDSDVVKTMQGQKAKKSKIKPKKTMSKFHRGMAYYEGLKRRSKRAKEKAKEQNLRKDHDERDISPPQSPVKVRSVYKNPRGFVSSATSLSSKISDLGSSSPCPQSIPSLNIGYSATRRISSSDNQRKHGHHYQQGIVKKKHKLNAKEVTYSKKKTKSIYDMLLQYINLTNDDDPGVVGKSPRQKCDLINDESRIVILSVSSLKLKRPPDRRQQRLKRKLSTPEDQSDSDPVVENPDKIKHKTGTNKPFFIGNQRQENVRQKPVPKRRPSSEDSLEYNTPSHTPDLCPLTAIFNFEPPKRDFLVYNTEVFSPNKPKIEIKTPSHSPRDASRDASLPSTSHDSQPSHNHNFPQSEPSTSHRLMTIMEERVAVDRPRSARSPSPQPIRPREDPDCRVADLSPVLSRRAYPTYDDCMKCLESIEDEDKPKPKLTTFNCNDRECSNLIFNYTSKKDPSQSTRFYATAPSTCERHESSAYHTMTTIMDSKSVSFQSPSECDTAVKNESGYESSKKSSTFMSFFKKRTLLDVFKTKIKKKAMECGPSVSETLAMTDKRSPMCIISQESLEDQQMSEYESMSNEAERSPFAEAKTVLWFNFRKKKREAGHGCDPWCKNKRDPNDPNEIPPGCSGTCHKTTKCMSTNTWKGILRHPLKTECPCNLPFDQQREQCKKYATKVLMEAAERQKGYERQYAQFEEMPLKVLMGSRKCECAKLNQGCAKSYANKAAAIQVKQPQKSTPIQVKRSPPPSFHESPAGSPPKTPRETMEKLPTPRRSVRESEHEEQLRESIKIPTLDSTEDVTKLPSLEKPADADVSSIRSFTDKEIFDRLLHEYERKDMIADRLSSDEQFYNDQMNAANSGVAPDLQVQHRTERREEERVRGPRFSDRPKPLVHIAADTTVRPDDIGTCFARGFRPDNLMLSGDACFHINKQDKVKMSPYMLKNTESIIDFSERETPLDFLLALGFMVDEASNALKDDDIRSRLLAAITEARVWINKITTTQGTLLYLVAYKARPETMRYFLQLVEAIINRRINNAIRLDGFLRVLEDVEAGRVQMINILGQDKFEDEENEEKIVKKQLKSLFITVYTVAEKEASVTGRSLTSNQINLLRILVAKYRAGLHPHLELIARYIGQGLLENEIQLEAAMIFLSRLDTAEVKLKEFENYCGITCQLQDS